MTRMTLPGCPKNSREPGLPGNPRMTRVEPQAPPKEDQDDHGKIKELGGPAQLSSWPPFGFLPRLPGTSSNNLRREINRGVP